MVDYYEKSRHHLSVTDPSTANVLGFCLARKQGELAYAEHDGKYLADQFFSDAATQSNLDPEKELLLGQSDWRSGFGLSIYDPNDPKRYESSYGADLRFKDRAMLSYGATAIAPPTADTAQYINPTSTNDPSSTWTNDANAIDGNAATSATDSVDAAQYTGFLEAHIVSMSCSKVKVKADISGGSNEIDIDAYYNGAWNGVHDGVWTEASEQEFSLGGTYAITAVRVRIKNTQAGVETATLYLIQFYQTAVTVGYPTAHATFNDLEYITFGKYLVKMNGTGDGWTKIKTFGTDVTDMAVMTISNTDYLFIALGYSDAYVYMTTAEALTTSTATNNLYKFFKVVNTTAPTMYGNDTNSTIRSTTNPLNGGTAWSAQTQVGVDFYDILDLFTTSGALYIRKEDIPYYLNSAGAVQNDLAPECEPMAADTSGRAVTVWGNEVFYVAGLSSLVRIGTTNSWISPSEYCTNLGAFTGQIFALAGDDRYLIAIVDNSILSDDFEWGSDGDSLATSGETVTWTVTAAGTSRAEIDTAQAYAGTRSARLYRDGTNNPEAYFTQTASTDYNIQFRMRKDETSLFYFSHGNGTKQIYIQVSAGELIYYYDTAWRATGSSVSINTWYLFGIRNINWTAGTYDIYLDNVLIQSGAVMETSGSNSDKIDFLNSQGTSELWIDNIEVYNVEVMFGREEDVDGTTAWRWHPYQGTTLIGCNIAWVSSVFQKRAWIASNTNGENLYYIPLPDNYGNVENDTNRSFATGGYFTTPFLHGNFKETTKGLISVSASLGHAYDADIYWECHYKKLGDSSWTDMDDMKGTATDRTHTLYRTTSTTSPMFQYKFVGVTDNTAKTPILLGYTVKLIMYPTIRKLIFCTVRVGDSVTDKAGLSNSKLTALQKTCLDNARDASWLVTFTDLDGTSLKGKFLPLPTGTPRRVPVKDEKGRTIEWEYNLLIMCVDTE